MHLTPSINDGKGLLSRAMMFLVALSCAQSALACTFSVGGSCYEDLNAAVNAAGSGDTITVGDSYTVRQEVKITKSLNFVGDGRPMLTAQLSSSSTSATMFRATKGGSALTFRNIDFVNDGERASVLRTTELGTGTYPEADTVGPISLYVSDCSFTKFNTGMRGGSVFFIGNTKSVKITGSTFTENVVDFELPLMYRGGGAVYIEKAQRADVEISDSVFENNSGTFGHACGSAVGINQFLGGSLSITGSKFTGNVANGGGALWVNKILNSATIDIDSEFIGNVAKNLGFDSGARGGAIWIEQVGDGSEVNIDGRFEDNEAPDDGCGGLFRGGAIANNRVYGTVNLGGYYANNKAAPGSGSVWDTHYLSQGPLNDNTDIGPGNTKPYISYDADREYVQPE
eukprot:comp61115_c0_seq1/m.47886 comp61115_c0_seq1/g.47886  ORF comp61115_c0_seq1/g.47886 comp61115_c0_seq1/m.47886 type:complete len:399 (-) comp61115_c0_seq1:130-1326(-)